MVIYAGRAVENGRRLAKLLASRVGDGALTRRYRRGEVLFHQGDVANSLHVVTAGRVAVRLLTEDGHTVTVAVVGPGNVLGELALLTPEGRRSASAEALEPVETSSIDRRLFDDLRATLPEVDDILLALLAARVRELDALLLEALHVPAEVRVLRRLRELAELYGEVVPLRQEDLAGLAGTTRGTVNRLLQRLVQSGTVELDRKRIRVLDHAALAEAAGGPAAAS